jgi:hypothetical protein
LPDHRSHKCSKKATDITDIRKTLLFGDIGIDESSAGASGVEKMTKGQTTIYKSSSTKPTKNLG